MVVLTIAVVSAMYRLVMQWVTDGSGGSGLSEEEFGSWAVKVNAAITFVEYTLTFLVSMAAMVTFIADRLPLLNERILWIQYRTIVAILLSVLVGWLVNRGPRIAARAFGPATAGVLLLLWGMVIATILQQGFHLPDFNLAAFNLDNLEFTIGGYVRILAVMTGIEVFANLVAAYDGSDDEKSSKAFRSLLIIMGTTGVTMLIVGPAILNLADPRLEEVSVFTQTMDQLLPAPLPLVGTLVGVAVLMSASAAASQGIQNLALGLKERRYIPPFLGQQNQYDVADKPVWIQVAIVAVVYLLFGTDEETYLAIYAAGVFILLSMTGWAVMKRLLRNLRQEFSIGKLPLITGTVVAAILTTAATVIIFEERFLEGAWTYFLFIPVLFAFFSYFRDRLGEPTAEMEAIGQFNMAQLGGFGFGQSTVASNNGAGSQVEITWLPEPIEGSHWREERVEIHHIAVLLDGSAYAAQALPAAQLVAKSSHAKLTLLSSVKDHTQELKAAFEATKQARESYLREVAGEVRESGVDVDYTVRPGFIADATQSLVDEQGVDLIVTTTRGKSGESHWSRGGASRKLVQKVATPLLLVRAVDEQLNGKPPEIDNILIALDGSIYSEAVLPYARVFAKAFQSKLTLLSVPAVPDTRGYRAASDAVLQLRQRAEVNMKDFLDAVAKSLREDGLEVITIVTGDMPARTIVAIGEDVDADLVMMTSRGRGGVELLLMGSVAERVVQQTPTPVFMVPVQERLE